MIKPLRNAVSTQMIWNTYFAYIEAKLRYGIIFWGYDKKIHTGIAVTKQGY
jgi:hypothetical protein